MNNESSLKRIDPSLPDYNDRVDVVMDNNLLWVDWDGGDLHEMEKKGFKHAGWETYLISPITERNMFSDKYINCTGVLAIGIDCRTGKKVAFLSHQNPEYFIDDEDVAQKFSLDLKESLGEINEQTGDGTLEVFVFGGNYDPTDLSSGHSDTYRKSIKLLGKIIQEKLGIDPQVLTGPNIRIGSGTDVILDTQARNVFINRSEQPSELDVPFRVSEIIDSEKNWSV